MSSLSVEIFDRLKDAEPLWREIAAKADLHVFQAFDWLADWHRAIGEAKGIKPCLIALRDQDRQLLMLLPLAIERCGLWRRLVWMGAEFFDYHAPILMPDATSRLRAIGVEAAWRAIVEQLRRVDYVDFQRQPEVVGHQANPLIGLAGVPCTQGAHHTDLFRFGDWPTYYATKRGKRTRHNDRRKRKKLEGQGTLSFLIAKSDDDIDRLVSAMISQKQAFTDARGEKNLLAQPGYRQFLCDQAARGVKDGSIILCGLDLDGDILAVQWGAVHRARLYSIIASYHHGRYGKLSPGEVLLHEVMRWCFENQIETFDFTYGDEPYKAAWCEHQVTLYRSAIPVTACGAARVFPLRWHMRLKRWAKNKEWLVAAHAWTRKKACLTYTKPHGT